MLESTFTAPMAGMTVSSVNVPEPAICEIGEPSSEKRGVMSSMPPLIEAIEPTSQSSPWSCLHM